MAKANPKKWFPSPFTVRIDLRKVDRLAEYGAKIGKPYFDTWSDAHAQLSAWSVRGAEKAQQDAEAAKRAIKAAAVRIQKVSDLKPPNAPQTEIPPLGLFRPGNSC
jgi:hypothetical protein